MGTLKKRMSRRRFFLTAMAGLHEATWVIYYQARIDEKPLHWIARRFHSSVSHIRNLVERGDKHVINTTGYPALRGWLPDHDLLTAKWDRKYGHAAVDDLDIPAAMK